MVAVPISCISYFPQMVSDSAMARHAVRFLEEHPGYIIVVLTGMGHSWRRAIPEQVRHSSDFSYRVILLSLPGLLRRKVTAEDTAYLWLNLALQR